MFKISLINLFQVLITIICILLVSNIQEINGQGVEGKHTNN